MPISKEAFFVPLKSSFSAVIARSVKITLPFASCLVPLISIFTGLEIIEPDAQSGSQSFEKKIPVAEAELLSQEEYLIWSMYIPPSAQVNVIWLGFWAYPYPHSEMKVSSLEDDPEFPTTPQPETIKRDRTAAVTRIDLLAKYP